MGIEDGTTRMPPAQGPSCLTSREGRVQLSPLVSALSIRKSGSSTTVPCSTGHWTVAHGPADDPSGICIHHRGQI